jgi:EamA domain-containing membrane protein RarD
LVKNNPRLITSRRRRSSRRVFLFLVTNLHGIEAVFQDTRAWTGVIFGLGLFGTGLAYLIYYFIVENLCAVASAGVTYIPPVVALVIGVFLLGDSINPIGYAAMILILSGVAAQPCQHVGKRLQTRRARRHTWLVFRLCEEIIVR